MNISTIFSSKNFNTRKDNTKINAIILHYTEISFEETINKFCEDKNSNVSSHYLVRRNGEIYKLVDESNRAWHAGLSYFKNQKDYNEISIGIEIDNNGEEEFSNEIYDSVIRLCKYLSIKYNIHLSNVYGHSDIAPERKIDPGIFFNWKLLSNFGIGIFFPEISDFEEKKFQEDFKKKFASEIYYPEEDIASFELKLIQEKLNIIGYSIDVNGIFDSKTNSVFRAFQIHFNPEFIFDKIGITCLKDLSKKYGWHYKSNIILDKIYQKYNNDIVEKI